MSQRIRIGSRESALAVAQAEIVMNSIIACDPNMEVELVTIKTAAEQHPEAPLDEIGGKEVFIKELEQALMDREVDLCVHSYKDMPMDQSPLLPICAVGKREDPRDVLVLPEGASPDEQIHGRVIGTSSLRRQLQLQMLYPGCQVKAVRGNILTRLEKLDGGEYDGLVLAAAALRRLGLENRISRYFLPHQMLPACCQGVIAVQCRAGENTAYLAEFHDAMTWDVCVAERAFLKTLGGGCRSPIAAHAEAEFDSLRIKGYILDQYEHIVEGTFTGRRSRAQQLGIELAVFLKVEADSR